MEQIAQFLDAQVGQAGGFGPLIVGALTVAAAVLVAVVLHSVLYVFLRKVTSRTRSNVDELLVTYSAKPTRWILTILAVTSVVEALPLDGDGEELARRVLALGLTACVGWLMVSGVRAGMEYVRLHYDIEVEDNLEARRVRTKAAILERIAIAIITLVTVCLMLMSFPSIRHIGVTLFASAGLAALAVGAAAQPALKNIIAGVQLAVSQPISLDDVVIWNGEFARVEEIRLTYVVLRTWDERRLIVPISKFLEETFENWTRRSAHLIGSVFLQVDYSVPVDPIRAEFLRIVEGHHLWDGRAAKLQVTDVKDRTTELRAIMSATNASNAWDLRCDVRERLIAFIAARHPGALPRERAEVVGDTPPIFLAARREAAE